MKNQHNNSVPEAVNCEPLLEAVDSMVHFSDESRPAFRAFHDDGGLTDLEIARTISLCFLQSAC